MTSYPGFEGDFMSDRNKTAMYLAVAAGVLLLVAGITGVAFINKIQEFVLKQFGQNDMLKWVFVVLIFLSSLGGILVIAGGVLVGKNKVGGGKILITIGVGVGLIGVIIALYWVAVSQKIETSMTSIFGLVGVILSVAARMTAKKDDAPQAPPGQPQQPSGYPQPPQAQAQPQPQAAPQPAPQPAPVSASPAPKQARSCPDCGTPMDFISQYGRYYCPICMKYP
jgi:uncharacterized membrane protein HdeD (DUF308 family)